MADKKLYDVYFIPIAHPCICVEAKDAKSAKEIGEELLANMDKEDILERIANAMDLCGNKVTFVERI